MQQRLPSLRHRPIGFGHRGAKAYAPENTLESFRLALRLGSTGLETDAFLTADGEVVLDHDGMVRVGLRNRPIGEVERRRLPAHIPTLGELYDACGTGFELSIDLKDDRVGERIVDLVLADVPAAAEHLWLCHPRWEHVAALRGRSPDVKLVDSTRLKALKEGPERRAATLRQHGVDAINLHNSDWTGGLTTLFHRFDRYCLSWDLQFERLLVDTVRMGMDGLFSDYPDRMMEAIAQECGPAAP